MLIFILMDRTVRLDSVLGTNAWGTSIWLHLWTVKADVYGSKEKG